MDFNTIPIRFTINGEKIKIEIPAGISALEMIRDILGLKGTKEGCGIGECGACTIVVDGKAVNGRLFFDAMPGYADGIRCDTEGNVWCGFSGGPGQDGVAVFAPDGTLIGRILLPERCANLCFGGRKRNRLFMTASQSVYALYVEAQGNPGG